jgi:Tol biopolymer transport system component
MVRDLDTGEEKELCHVWGIGFALSPNGEQVALCSRNVLQVMLAGGGKPRELLKLSPSECFSCWMGPAWMPDGRHIIFGRVKSLDPDDPEAATNQGVELWRIPIDGGESQKLGLSMAGGHRFSVHPDGRQIAFTQSEDHPRSGIWAMENFLPETRAIR